jgi:hypothetical protein
MSVEGAHKFSCIAVPELYLFVKTARSNVPSIGGEKNMNDWLAVAHHLLDRNLAWQFK